MKNKLFILLLTVAVLSVPVAAFANGGAEDAEGAKLALPSMTTQEEWDKGWNADRSQYKDEAGNIVTGLFKATRQDGVITALYYADADGTVRKESFIVTVPGDKKRFLKTENIIGRTGFNEVPATDTNPYTYFITSAGDSDFIVSETSGVFDYNNAKYFLRTDGTVQTKAGFVNANGVTYFAQEGGQIRTTAGWIDFDGKRYLAGAGGVLNMTVGIVNYEGNLYVLQADHSLCTNIGIARVDGKLYYISNSSGVLAKNKTVKAGKKIYHVKSNGVVAVGVHKWKNKYYYSTANGFLKTKKGIVSQNGKRYYVKKGGRIVTDKKIKYKKKLYIAGKKGAFKTGVFKWKKELYYANKKGALKTKGGMVTYNGYSYYARSGSGKLYVNTQFTVKGNTYMADAKGHLLSGIYKWKNKYYYAEENFTLRKTEGIIKVDGKSYYNKKGGGLAKDQFFDYNGSHYYAGSDAVIKTSTFTYKGISITPNSSGQISDDDYYKVFPEKKENTNNTDNTDNTTNNTTTTQ